MTDKEGSTFIIHYRAIDNEIGNEEIPANTQDSTINTPVQKQPQQQQQSIPPPVQDSHWNTEAEKSMITSFLSGTQCLDGVN